MPEKLEPQWNERKIAYLKQVLRSFQTDTVHVLEWGSGGSTIYFPRFLRQEGIPFTWTSIEHDKEWQMAVSKEVAEMPEVRVKLFDAGGDNPRRRDVPMDEYVEYPRKLGKKFDLIIVDGRKRRRCLLEARNLLSQNGVVILDDAFRPYYHCALKRFPENKFLWLHFWRGSLRCLPLRERLKNRCTNAFWRSVAVARHFLRHAKWRIWRNLRRAGHRATSKNSNRG